MARRLIAVSLAVFALVSAAAPAQTTWTGVVGTDWAVAGNWSAGVPTAAIDAVIPAGAPNQPSTAGVAAAACRDLTVNAGATLVIAPGSPLAVNRGASVPGAISGGGLLRFVGSSGATVTNAGTIGAGVEIAKSGGAILSVGSSWTVNGDLTLTSGMFSVAQAPTHVVAVAGNATFSGGSLGAPFAATIDVAGHVTFSGTACTGLTPTVRCGGTWTSNAPYAPTSGSVVLDGVGAQSIVGNGTLPGLTIAATSSATRAGAMTLAGGLTLNGSLAHSGGTLQINGTATVNGTLSMPSATLDANGNFTVAATGSLDLGAGTHTFGANYTGTGSVTATGLFVFDSSAGSTVSGPPSLPSVQISKSSGANVFVNSSWTVNGDLSLTSGTFNVGQAPTHVVSVSGNATFSGGTLAAPFAATIDVAGNVTLSGTACTGLTPTIRCGGTWTSNAAYAPTTGNVVLDGVGAQSILGNGTLPGLTIAATSSATRTGALTLAGGLTLDGSLAHSGGPLQINGVATVNGTLSMPSSTLDANENFTVAATGAVDLGAGTHTFGAGYTGTGSVTATGLFVFDSSAGSTVSGSPSLPSVQISKSGGANVFVSSSWTVNGDLTLVSGVFNVALAPSYVVSVSGNATFSSGTLGTPFAGTIDVAGDVTFTGTPVTGLMPTIRCAGDWTSSAAFAPTNGNVVLDGSAPQTVSVAGKFATLTIAAGASVTSPGPLTVDGTLTVNGALSIPTASLDANGNFTVASTGSANLGSGTHTFALNYTVSGSVTATGTFVFDSINTATAITTAPLPSVQVAKAGSAPLTAGSDWTVNGTLTLISGGLSVSAAPGFVVSVLGNATFSGGVLGVPVAGTIDVAGNVTFSGTPVPGIMPTIRCAGTWTSNAAFAPSGGTVVLDGTAPQTVAVAGKFATLTIAASASVTSFGPLTVDGTLTVNGALSIPTASLDANGNFTVAATGSANLGSGTHTFALNYTVAGSVTATGAFVFDSANTATATAVAPLPSIQIAKAGSAPLIVGSSLTVSGDLTLTSGGLSVAASPTYVVSVSGNATFEGGVLGVPTTGTIDVEGDVTFSGTTTSFLIPTIRCAGNWISDGGFVATSGIVEFDGIAPTTFTSTTGTLQLLTLKIRNGTRSASPGLTVSATTIIVESTGTLALGPWHQLDVHRPAGPTALTIDGALTLVNNSVLALGPQTSATVSSSGLLSLIGFVEEPARIAGAAGGGYALIVNGTIAAKNFVMREMGTAGVVINASATLAAPPNDFRGGSFDFRPGAAPGSVLLDVRRAAPTNIRYATFLNTPGAAGVFNVKTVASSAPVSLTNWTGAFSGAPFENDPNSLIAWNPPQQTTLSFSVLPGAEVAEITWSGITFVDFAEFSLRRATNPAGPWVQIALIDDVQTSYGWIDDPLAPNQTWYYELHQRLTHDPWIFLAAGACTPYSSGPPPNVYKVGGGGAYASIQAAVNAAVNPISVVWVTPGTYAPFSIGPSAPSNLRILGDGTGPINVDTSSGPVQITNVPATSGIEIGNMTIGSSLTVQSAIEISNTLAPVVLDELTVASAASLAAISVSGSPGVAIQRCDVTGGPGVLAAASSYVALSRGSLSSLVSTGSTIEITNLVPGSVNVNPAASLIAHAGLMPNLELPEYPRLSFGVTLFYDGFPGQPVTLLVASRLGFLTAPPLTEMPILFDISGVTILPPIPTDPAGHFQTSFEFPPVAALLGSSYVVQAAAINPLTGSYRLSNVATMVALP